MDTKSVLAALEQVIDPELGVDIVNLGLVYGVRVEAQSGEVHVTMTLTTAGCPLSDSLAEAARRAVLTIPGVRTAQIELVWTPQWDPSMITPAGLQQLARNR